MQLPPLMKHLSLFPQPLSDYAVIPGIYSFLTPNERHTSVLSALKLRRNGTRRITTPLPPDSGSQSEHYGTPGSQTAWLTSSQLIFASYPPRKPCLRWDQGWRLSSQSMWNLQTGRYPCYALTVLGHTHRKSSEEPPGDKSLADQWLALPTSLTFSVVSDCEITTAHDQSCGQTGRRTWVNCDHSNNLFMSIIGIESHSK